jgi:lipopolysaccharide transport system ATP-binding protein
VLIHDIRGKKESIATDGAGLRDGEFFAVKDVSFELRRGECLGLIGHNGAGKTTLLKMLNGLIKPDRGSITMRGRVGALIALGAGFNPILTGRENIYINGSVLGLAKKEIDAKIDEIIDFAEIGEFIDMPVMNYSSGMAVRLGFAVAVSLDPDVLIIDEVLAVGDLGFQAKCFNILNKKLKNSAVIFVSHSMPQVARVASKVLYMEHGEPICYTNDLGEGIEKYHGSFKNEEATVTGSGGAVLESFTLNGLESFNSKDTNARVRYSDSLEVGFRYRLSDTVQRCSISLCIYDKSLKMVAMVISRAQDTFFKNTSGINAVSVCIKDIPLAPGTYSLTINFTDAPEDSNEWGEILARYGAVSSFTVTGNKNHALSHAPIIFLGKWSY